MKLLKLTAGAFFTTCLALLITANTYAQDTKVVGNKSKSDGTNVGIHVRKGGQVGVKVNVGSKPVQVLKFNFKTTDDLADSVRFKINIYDMEGKFPGQNLVKQEIIGFIPKKKGIASVDLTPYNVVVKGKLFVAIEFLDTKSMQPMFSSGLFNGGTYEYSSVTSEWKKIPVVGVGFNLEVRKTS